MSEDEISDSEAASLDTAIERRAVSDRRRLSLRTFLQGGLTPRRRDGRRDGEHEHLKKGPKAGQSGEFLAGQRHGVCRVQFGN